MQENQNLELQRLLRWIRNHRSEWDTICCNTELEILEIEDINCLLTAMLDNGFYQIALVILNCYPMSPKGNDALYQAFIDTMLEKNNATEIVNFMQAVMRNAVGADIIRP